MEWIGTRLREHMDRVFVLKGGMGSKQRAQIVGELAATEDRPRIIVATGSYVGEGFDDARLDTLFLAMPISWKGTLTQYAGRLHRLRLRRPHHPPHHFQEDEAEDRHEQDPEDGVPVEKEFLNVSGHLPSVETKPRFPHRTFVQIRENG